ncbi:unnamed protein product [Diamesa serratosioi]
MENKLVNLSVEPQSSTSGYKAARTPIVGDKPSPFIFEASKVPAASKVRAERQLKSSTKAIKLQTNIFDGPKKVFTTETLPKVSRLSTVMDKVELKKTKEICEKIVAIQITKEDVQCQVEHLTANIFCDNLYLVGEDLSNCRGEQTNFLRRIVKGLREPKFLKRGPLGADVAKTLDPNAEADEGNTETIEEPESAQSLEKVYGTTDGDFQLEADDKAGDRGILGAMIPRMAKYVWSSKFKKVLMRFQRLDDQPKFVIPKMKANELVIIHHPNMVRQSKVPRLRTDAEQLKRDKNTFATRVTRARIQFHEEQVQLQSAYIEYCNINCRRRNACLMVYLNMLLVFGGEGPRDFIIVIEKIMALQFMEGEEEWNKADDDDYYAEEDLTMEDSDVSEGDLVIDESVAGDCDVTESDLVIDESVAGDCDVTESDLVIDESVAEDCDVTEGDLIIDESVMEDDS